MGINGAGLLVLAPSISGPLAVLCLDVAGVWDLPGGQRLVAELPRDTAFREFIVKTGLVDFSFPCLRILGSRDASNVAGTYTTVVALAEGPFTIIPAGDAVAVAWVTLSRVRDLKLDPGLRNVWTWAMNASGVRV